MRMERSSSKSSLFLIELLIIIAFFAVSSVVCVRLFARAHVLSMDSRDLNRAVTAAQSAAESFKAAGGDADRTARLLDALIGEDGAVLLYFDNNWSPVAAKSEQGYTLRMQISRQGDVAVADILVAGGRQSRDIYAVQAARHLLQ